MEDTVNFALSHFSQGYCGSILPVPVEFDTSYLLWIVIFKN